MHRGLRRFNSARSCRKKQAGSTAVGAGQPHVEFRLGWSGLIAQAAESMGARLVIDELSHIASDGRLPSAATRSRATTEGQERDLELRAPSTDRCKRIRHLKMKWKSRPALCVRTAKRCSCHRDGDRGRVEGHLQEEEGDGSPEGGHVLEGPAVQPRG